MFKAASGLRIKVTVLFDETRRHAAVGMHTRLFGEALLLHGARGLDTLSLIHI